MTGTFLGHHQPETTARYSHATRQLVKTIAEHIIDSLLANVNVGSGKLTAIVIPTWGPKQRPNSH